MLYLKGCKAKIYNTLRDWESHSKICPAFKEVRQMCLVYESANAHESQHFNTDKFVSCINSAYGELRLEILIGGKITSQYFH